MAAAAAASRTVAAVSVVPITSWLLQLQSPPGPIGQDNHGMGTLAGSHGALFGTVRADDGLVSLLLARVSLMVQIWLILIQMELQAPIALTEAFKTWDPEYPFQ